MPQAWPPSAPGGPTTPYDAYVETIGDEIMNDALWAEADQAMARANARVMAAEREMRLYQERIDQVNAVGG